jgi:hypothetical protein
MFICNKSCRPPMRQSDDPSALLEHPAALADYNYQFIERAMHTHCRTFLGISGQGHSDRTGGTSHLPLHARLDRHPSPVLRTIRRAIRWIKRATHRKAKTSAREQTRRCEPNPVSESNYKNIWPVISFLPLHGRVSFTSTVHPLT